MKTERDERRQALRFISTHIRSYVPLVVTTIAMGLVAGLFEGGSIGFLYVALKALIGDYTINQLIPAALAPYVDSSETSWSPTRLFMAILILAVVVQVFRSGIEIGNKITSLHLGTRVGKDIHMRIVNQIMELTYSRIMRYKTGELTTFIGHSRDIASFVQTSSQIFITTVYIAIYIGFLCWLSMQITMITSVLFIAVLASTWRLVAWARHLAKKQAIDVKSLNSQLIEYIQGIRILHLLSIQKYAADRMKDSLEETLKTRLKSSKLQSISGPLMETIAISGLVAMLIGIFMTSQETLENSLPSVLAFLFVLWRLLLKNIRLRQTQLNLIRLIPYIGQIEGFLQPDATSGRFLDGHLPFKQLCEDIVLENVTFQYDGNDSPAIADVSFRIARGSMVALVGVSGTGKTTIVNLATRLIDPTHGRILVDGVDLRDLHVGQWRNQIGIVSQDEFLFDISIRDNISLGLADTEDQAVLEAARIAHAHEFIEQLPGGYDTVIGEKGHRLSGGQRQRIALARAVIRKPDILILDEATSNLDSHSESMIQSALADIATDHTVLIVAHRLSTIKQAGCILVLDRNQLVAQGTHEELIGYDDVYTRMWALQSGESKVEESGPIDDT